MTPRTLLRWLVDQLAGPPKPVGQMAALHIYRTPDFVVHTEPRKGETA